MVFRHSILGSPGTQSSRMEHICLLFVCVWVSEVRHSSSDWEAFRVESHREVSSWRERWALDPRDTADAASLPT